MSVLLLVIGIFLFILLVVVHEFGHFIMARRNGVQVEEFGIFFPPRLYSHRTKAGWIFTINLLPLGGFVKLKGEHDTDTVRGSYGASSLLAKSKIMAAGVVMNLITALVLLTILALIGMPKLLDNQFTIKSDTKVSNQEVLISYVLSGSPAQKAGLQAEDEITGLGLIGQKPMVVKSSETLPSITKSFAGKTVDVYYTRAGQKHVSDITLLTKQAVSASLKTNNPQGYLGIAPTDLTLQRSTWSAPIVAVGLSTQVTVLTFEGLGHALGGLGSLLAGAATGNKTARQNGQTSASSQVSGPVGIYVILKDGSLLGYQYMLFIIAIISLTLAIMNILPIPALDGGRLWITLVTRALNRPLSAKREEAITATGFALLMVLIILITIVDVKRYY
jgi:regulator of sigma E protease